jgi:hypothetical protein
MVSAGILSDFLEKIRQGICPARVFMGLKTMSKASGYRIYNRFRHNQVRIRTLLTRIKDPPDLSCIRDPVVQTIVHLRAVFKGCMVSQFQQYFQVSFL